MTIDAVARPRGWTLTLVLSAALLAGAAAIYAAYDVPVEGIRRVIRVTAHTSLTLFLLAFLSSTLVRLWPSGWTRWIRDRRRQFGVSFAVSHIIHAAAIIALAKTDEPLFWTLSSAGNIAAGSTAYVVILLMFATSFDATARMIGPRVWTRLHGFGSWYIWLFFMITNGKRIPESLNYALPVAILIIAAGVKVYVRRQQRSAVKALA
jgi:methionine sulfoxide reductase heme-binding subunit